MKAMLCAILVFALGGMAADTTQTGPMCAFHTKMKDGVTGINCTSSRYFILTVEGKNAPTFDHCDSAIVEYKDTTWYATCKK